MDKGHKQGRSFYTLILSSPGSHQLPSEDVCTQANTDDVGSLVTVLWSVEMPWGFVENVMMSCAAVETVRMNQSVVSC